MLIDSGEIGPRGKKGAQDLPNLIGIEFEIIEFLKRDSPSMPLSKIYDVVDSYCVIPGGTSKAAICRAIRKSMSCGPNVKISLLLFVSFFQWTLFN